MLGYWFLPYLAQRELNIGVCVLNWVSAIQLQLPCLGMHNSVCFLLGSGVAAQPYCQPRWGVWKDNKGLLTVSVKLGRRLMLSKAIDLTFVTNRRILSLSSEVLLNCSIFSAEERKFVHLFLEVEDSRDFVVWFEILRKGKINGIVEFWLKTHFVI